MAVTLKTANMLNWTVSWRNVTEGAAMSTVLKVTQVEPSHGFGAWQALVDGCAAKSSNDPSFALQPTLAPPERCKEGEAHTGNKGKGKGKGKSETRYFHNCGEQGHIGVNCPNSIEEEENRHSSWESEPEGEQAEELASLDAPDDEGEWCWPRRNRITRWRKRMDPRPAFHHFAEDDEEEHVSGELNHLVL